jgi:hypothetical protein
MVKIKQKWYSQTQRGRPLMKYYPKGYRSSGVVISATIYKDPILKKYPDWHRAILNHELTEIKARSKGIPLNKAHKIARSKETKLTKNLSLRQMWDKLNG